ncbi:uncharacterized protein LOC143205642 [Rhynchophorus ferrugineus]|uniref:uncharacterized protein LOC143205642 n=1 Tax=Rhynchophorus ferrugineus TaxID=354439 RepID=UPI003FCDE048
MISDNIKTEEKSSNELDPVEYNMLANSSLDQTQTARQAQDQISSLDSQAKTLPKSKPCEDGAIILLADEETDLSPISTDTQVPNAGANHKEIINTGEKDKEKPIRSVWISNIPKTLKAIDLKKLFSQHFKVQCARIITNGWNFFGYITLENYEMAKDAITMFNGFTLNKRKISVSLRRPELKAKPQSDEFEDHLMAEGLDEEPTKEKTKMKKEDIQKIPDIKCADVDIIENLKKELSDVKSDHRRTRKRLQAAYKLLDEERDRKAKLLKEVGKLQFLLKKEQRKFDEEKSYWEKKLKAESARYYADRSIINRELDECKRLRECLQSNMVEMNNRNRQRSVSPFNRERHHSKIHERQPTPPPAPKLSKHSPIKRNKPSTYQRGVKRAHTYSNNTNANMYQRSGQFQNNLSPWASFGYQLRQNEAPSAIGGNYSSNSGGSSMVPRPNVYTHFQKPFSADSKRY